MALGKLGSYLLRRKLSVCHACTKKAGLSITCQKLLEGKSTLVTVLNIWKRGGVKRNKTLNMTKREKKKKKKTNKETDKQN